MSSHPAEEVKIKLRHGEWEVEVTCLESRVKNVVENVLSSLDVSSVMAPTVQSQIDELSREIDALKVRSITEPRSDEDEKKATTKGGVTCRSLLEGLWFEGHFISEKSLSEVHEELSRRGYNYDRTAVSHSLTDMVRENILTRIGTMRNYRYIQKRPPNGISVQT